MEVALHSDSWVVQMKGLLLHVVYHLWSIQRDPALRGGDGITANDSKASAHSILN